MFIPYFSFGRGGIGGTYPRLSFTGWGGGAGGTYPASTGGFGMGTCLIGGC